jgi:hypothetical protein
MCPHCGRVFTAVRCPECGYVGQARDFGAGCPNCGYAGDTREQKANFETVDLTPRSGAPVKQIPPWVFPLAVGVLLVVFGILVILYLRL